MDCELELALSNQDRKKKYEYRINNTQAIAAVKDSFIDLVMEENHVNKRMPLNVFINASFEALSQ